VPSPPPPYDVVVVGLGLAGLTAALAAAGRGARVLALGKGYGTTHFRSGTVDVLGYLREEVVGAPREALAALAERSPQHPYVGLGDHLEGALGFLRDAAGRGGVVLLGDLDRNQLVATAAGTLRPTCLAPPSLLGTWDGARVLALGLGGFRDFDPELVAAVLPAAAARLGLEVTVRPARLSLAPLARRHLDGPALARLLDRPSFRRQLVEAVRPLARECTLLALPAVLGLEPDTAAALSAELGPVAELPGLPPSVPGMRLQRALERALRERGGRLQVGAEARLECASGRARALQLAAPGRQLWLPVRSVVLATGGLASGGLRLEPSGVVEPVANLPVVQPPGPPEGWFRERFVGDQGQPVDLAGVRADASMRPLDAEGRVVVENLFVAGGLLAGAERSLERSADGIACASGYVAGLRAAEAAA
jgi:glycerol-3-phosphate dehydrogenase subunit B